MKILDKLVSKIAVLSIALLAIIFILLPFNIIEILSLDNIMNFVKSVKSNYIYSVVGLLVLLISIKTLFSGIMGSSHRQNNVVTHMNFGDLKISDEAIEGLTQNIISKNVGIRNSEIIVSFLEGYISLQIKGQVAPEIDIPQMTADIQEKIKESIEKYTGIPVSQVNIDILSISSPMKSLK